MVFIPTYNTKYENDKTSLDLKYVLFVDICKYVITFVENCDCIELFRHVDR